MSKKLPEKSGAEEVDLGQLFKLIGNAFERLFKFIGGVLNKLFLGFVWLVFFVKKNFLKLVIAGVVGFGVGLLIDKITGPVYTSNIVVKQNYNTGENLYNLIEYYNSFVGKAENAASVFGQDIPQSDLKSIIGFRVVPTEDENLKIKNYDRYISSIDSTIAATIDYETYVDNRKDQDYTYQRITILSKEPNNLKKVFDNILSNISETKYFKNEQEKDIKELKNRELAILESLKESELLKSTYKRVLESTTQEPQKASQTSITIEGSEKAKETKEFELFQNDLLLRRELVNIEREKQDRENIIDVISSEFSVGVQDKTIEIFGFKTSKKIVFSILFLFIIILYLFGVEFLKYLERYNKSA